MVKRKPHIMKVDPEFINFREDFKKRTNIKISSQDFTKDITKFLVEEDLYPIMVRRAKKKKKRGLFG